MWQHVSRVLRYEYDTLSKDTLQLQAMSDNRIKWAFFASNLAFPTFEFCGIRWG